MSSANGLAAKFRPREEFFPRGPYRLLPFRFLRLSPEKRLLVNEVGEHLLLDNAAFDRLIRRELIPAETTYLDLKAKHFLSDSDSSTPLHLLAAKLRTKKAFLSGFTRLHIFVVTLRCEHSCHYCQVSRVTTDKDRFDMTEATALKALDLVFRSPAPELKIEFQGGEPLLNFDIIRLVVEEAERRALQLERKLEFVIATNLALLTDDMLSFCREHNVFLSTSLDGPAHLHNANRPRPGNNSYEVMVENLTRARAVLGHDRVSAIMTTSRRSLQYPQEIVDAYLKLGFRSIFLRPISPYGFALRTARRTGYRSEDFLRFYVAGLEHIVRLNEAGTHFIEVYAQILLTRILTPYATGYVDLQSPAGAVIGVAVYNYDGDVYATDESRMLAEMGDHQFRLGNVHRDSYEAMFLGPLARSVVASSIAESLPGCADCALQPFCGADPVFNYATQRDLVGHKPSSDFHHRNFFLIKYLLELYHSGPTARRILSSWVNEFDPTAAPSARARCDSALAAS